MIERIKSALLFYSIVLLYFYESQQPKWKGYVIFSIYSISSIVCYRYLGQDWVISGSKSFAHRNRGAKFRTFSCVKQRKSSENRSFQNFCGGDKRDRTADLLNAIDFFSRCPAKNMVNNGRNSTKQHFFRFQKFHCVQWLSFLFG